MSFNPRHFLVQTSPAVLERHLRANWPELAAKIDWTAPELDLRSSVLEAITGRAGETNGIVASLERVHLMANEAGDRAMTAACSVNLGLRRRLHSQPSHQERAFWLLEQEPALFVHAEEIRDTDQFWGSGRRWTGFLGPRNTWPLLDGEELDLFKGRIETAFRAYDGSGTNVAVEAFERGPTHVGRQGEGRVCQVLVYLEGLPAVSTEFAEAGVVRRNVRPAVELALVYAPDTGAIDVVAQCGRELREAVAKAFAEELFPAAGGVEPVRLRQVDLTGLSVERPLPVDPEDGISSARLLALRISPDGPEGRVTLEIGTKSKRTLHEAARSWFDSGDPLAHQPAITKARLSIKFEPPPGRSRGRSLQVELTVPYGCNLRDRSDKERLVGEKYLRRWGLLRDV
jgi:hypothetical protein